MLKTSDAIMHHFPAMGTIRTSKGRTIACLWRLSAGGRDRCADGNPAGTMPSGLLSYLQEKRNTRNVSLKHKEC